MVETLPTGTHVGPSTGGLIPDQRRTQPLVGLAPADRATPRGKPGNRWPNPRELAALMVNGILRLPARYRRGMFLDVVV